MKRRDFLSSGAALLASPALAQEAAIAAISDYERSSGGHIGLYAENVRTGAKLAWRADQRFVMCSTFKASLAACVLARVDRGEDSLERPIPYSAADVPDWYAPLARQNLARGALSVREMCRGAVELSDNTCANLLLASVGGPTALTAFWRSIGDETSRLDHNEPVLNRSPPGDPHDTTTPAAMAANVRRYVLGDVLSSASRERLTGWLLGCQTGADRLRAGLPASWRVGDKTGNNGKDAAGDIAIAWSAPDRPILVAVYTQGGSPSDDQLKAVFAAVGRTVGQRLA